MTQLPDEFIKYVKRYPELAILPEALLLPPVTSIRINPLKCNEVPSSVTQLLAGKVPWCEYGRYLNERPQFTFDPYMHQGIYYVQDASSMAIAAVIKQISDKSPVTYLDACAAPGGKTTCALASLPAGSVVVANEFDHRRASILQENLAKWGSKDVVVARGDTSKLSRLGAIFDIVAVDAPCSGEGMMRKDTQAIEQWSPRLIGSCAALQKDILSNVISSLKPGGYLIYSTCTFNTSENEENVKWLIENHDMTPVMIDSLEKIESIGKGIDCNFPCYRFIPGRIKGEGLFLSVLRKPDSNYKNTTKKRDVRNIDRTGIRNIQTWIDRDMELWVENNEILAASKENAELIRYISSQLDTLSSGTHVATLKGKDIIPSHELALSEIFIKEAFPNIEISIDQAISFLKKDNIELPDGTPRGYVLLTYDTIPLGFVKNIGNRSNNLLPKQWRILSRR